MACSDDQSTAAVPLNDAAPNGMATNPPAATSTSCTTSSTDATPTSTTATSPSPKRPNTPTIPPPLPSTHTFPTPTSTTPFWRLPTHPLDTHRSTPSLPTQTDILIIGAGMSGISIAWHLLHPCPSSPPSSPPPSNLPPPPPPAVAAPQILVLEARALSSGATGRNGGHVKLPLWHANHVFEKHGAAAAAELVRFQLAHVVELGMVAASVGMEGVGAGDEEEEEGRTGCEYLRTVSWDVFMDRKMWERRMAEVLKLRGVEEAGLGRLIEENVQILDAGEWRRRAGGGQDGDDDPIERIAGVRGQAAGALAVPAASLWPYRFVCGLAERIVGDGEGKVNLQTGTKVVGVSEERDGEGYYEVRTEGRGIVRAKTVVFATNGYTAGVLPRYKGVVLPVKGTAAYVRRERDKGGQVRTNTYNIFKGNGMVDYLIHRPDGGVVLGGAREAFPSDMAEFISTVDDSTQLNEPGARKYFVERMESAWADWEDEGARIDKIWTGIMGSTPDGYPHIGALPGKEGQYVCVGFNGAGMPHIFLSAKGVASMIRDGKEFEAVGIPRIFEVTEKRIKEEWDKEKFTKAKGLRR